MCKKLLIKYVIEFILIIMKKIREKNRSVASGLSVIDFERGERAEGERAQKELSGRQYHDLNKHPCQSVESVFENPLRYKSNTDLSDSTDASLGGRYCLPDSSTFIIGNPETASRVNLAALGTILQTNNVGCLVVYTFNKITKQQY